MIKDTNPDHYKVDGANFIEYMNDPKISGFGNWMFANGFNSGVWASRNWISVKDRLPQHYDRVPVLIKFKDEDMSDELHFNCLWYVHEPFSNGEKPHWERIGRHEYEVLYWFELPEPPKEVNENDKR